MRGTEMGLLVGEKEDAWKALELTWDRFLQQLGRGGLFFSYRQDP